MEDLERKVLENSYRIKALNDGLQRNDANFMDVRKDLEKLEESHYAVRDMVKEIVTASQATQRQAKDIANKTLTVRQFYVGIAGIFIALLALGLTALGIALSQ